MSRRDLKSVMLKNVPRGGRAPARGVRGPNADRAAASAMTRLIQCVRSMNIAQIGKAALAAAPGSRDVAGPPLIAKMCSHVD